MLLTVKALREKLAEFDDDEIIVVGMPWFEVYMTADCDVGRFELPRNYWRADDIIGLPDGVDYAVTIYHSENGNPFEELE